RKVDAGGEDHQRLGDAEDADDRHLLEDQRKIERGEELAAGGEGKDQDTDDEDDEGNSGREFMEKTLEPLYERRGLLLEAGHRLIGSLKPAFGKGGAARVLVHSPFLQNVLRPVAVGGAGYSGFPLSP